MRKKNDSPGGESSLPRRPVPRAVVPFLLSVLFAAAGGALFRVARVLRGLDVNQLLYYLEDSHVKRLGIGHYPVVQEVAAACVPWAAAAVLPVLLLWLRRPRTKRVLFILRVRLGRRLFQRELLKSRRLPAFLSALLFCAGLISISHTLQLPQYFAARSQGAGIYREEYADPLKQNITFPQGKRNLIHIVMESTEFTGSDRAHGGQWETNLIPNLTALAEENISFSTMIDLSGSNFTSGGLVAQSAGVTLQPYSYMPSMGTLGDILAEAGYRQVFMCGSDGDFGLRKDYFEQHHTEVWDLSTAQELDPEPDYKLNTWGLPDYVLYGHAKDVLTELSQSGDPFCLTFLTVDTHFFDGYPCQYCESLYPTQYENVIHCADNLVFQFLQWIQAQDFYEDTTVIITGDHLCMDHYFFVRQGVEIADRRIYNCIINPVPGLEPPSRDRTLTNVDIFPTTLRAMGAEWGGSRLGLGVDLFSGDPTLVEQMGQQTLGVRVLAEKTRFY